jgi:hypothetical protein
MLDHNLNEFLALT